MYANAAAIPTKLGGEQNGHIGIIMDAAVYSSISTAAYARPTEPGPYTQHGPGDSVVAQSDASAIQKEGRIICDLDENIDTRLNQEIIKAMEETYLYAKNRGTLGFMVSPPKNAWNI